MSEGHEQPRLGLLAVGSPARVALLILLGYAVLGAVAGVVWEWLWTPPTQVVQHHQLFYSDYASLRRVFTGTGFYVVVGGVASALASLVVTLLTRRHELVTLAASLAGSVVAALLMRVVGGWLGPGDPASAAAHAADGTRLLGRLTVDGASPYLIWPMTSLFVLALVFFAWPGHRRERPTHHAEPDPSEADVPSAPHG